MDTENCTNKGSLPRPIPAQNLEHVSFGDSKTDRGVDLVATYGNGNSTYGKKKLSHELPSCVA